MTSSPYNLALHEHLLALGYKHTHHEADWEDTGDAESGPMLSGGPAYDEYTGEDEYVFASEIGVLDREARDLELEKWIDAQQLPDYGQDLTRDQPAGGVYSAEWRK